jgi:hypothetical protein
VRVVADERDLGAFFIAYRITDHYVSADFPSPVSHPGFDRSPTIHSRIWAVRASHGAL